MFERSFALPDFEKYFIRLDHCKGTGGNENSLLLSKVKTEAGRKTSAFWGAKIFNKLPKNKRTESACKDFNFDF